MFRFFARAVFLATSLSTIHANASQAESVSGAYLAGRYAVSQNEFEHSSKYFLRALAADSSNLNLMEHSIFTNIAAGEFKRALPISTVLLQHNPENQISQLLSLANMAENSDFKGILSQLKDVTDDTALVDRLALAWAHLGNGEAKEAFAIFDAIAKRPGLTGFANYHKAMAKAVVGDFESADALLAAEGETAVNITRRGAIARAQILSQLEKNDVALSYFERVFGDVLDPELSNITQALSNGEKLKFSQITSARDGLAEVYYSFAQALEAEGNREYALLYGRVAQHIRPSHIDVLLLNANLLEGLEQYNLAIQTYKLVPTDHPAIFSAEMGRSVALQNAKQENAAIEVLEQLSRRFETQAVIYSALGDLQRSKENYPQAIQSYSQALELIPKESKSRWFSLYARGIAYERSDQWDKAETDFRDALKLNPEQPQVLNYLGYSLVEEDTNLDEALDMIQRAVNLRPESAYIVDSLGWVMFRLGRYDDALPPMERAVELLPSDPILNDHLGDVYWAVGRKREAEFQWSRALSFANSTETSYEEEELNPNRIRRKIEVGLDMVLSEEGAPPLKLAHDN